MFQNMFAADATPDSAGELTMLLQAL